MAKASADIEGALTAFSRNFFFSGAPALKQQFGDDKALASLELQKIPKVFTAKINKLAKLIAIIMKVRNAGLEDGDAVPEVD